MSEVNVRSHRAGRAGYDTGFVPIPTVETNLVGQTIYVSSIFVSNASASAVTVTIKQRSDGMVVYQKTLPAGSTDVLFFPEPIAFRDGIRHSASSTGAVINVAGYI